MFTSKGFTATRTRDIADEAGINLALLNYYFRSKEKLFAIIMQENMTRFVSAIAIPLNQVELTLQQKMEAVVEAYITMFLKHPDLPFFVINEVRHRAEDFAGEVGIKDMLMQSHFFRQVHDVAGKKMNPMHFLLNMLSLTAFPFVAAPMFKAVTNLSSEEFNQLMNERKQLIPLWMNTLLHAEPPIK